MTKRQRTSPLERAWKRAERESEVRAQVLADDRVTQLEQQLQADPLVATEVDHGEAEAAGVKD